MSTISSRMQLRIANVCYAYVAGNFAMFTNDKFRGPKFSWKDFPDMMHDQSKNWLFISNISTTNPSYVSYAQTTAKEIATTLVRHAGLM